MSNDVLVAENLVSVYVYENWCKKDNNESWWLIMKIIKFFVIKFSDYNSDTDEND